MESLKSRFISLQKNCDGLEISIRDFFNINSAKALDTVVGHEITHILEGTELYDALQESVFKYAESKGEYKTRREALEKLYEKVENANIDNKLTADLVGDYIFTDEAFIRNLSVNNRNVFQKIYDEIKYLCKVATAGSKEARELEKVKRAFEKAYKESKTETDANADVKYSLTGKNKFGIKVYETSKEVMDLTWEERTEKYLDLMKEEYRGSKENTKDHTKADYFDYFVKTVQIDGKVFDLVADVEKSYGANGGYVYTLALSDNKKIKASPTLATPEEVAVKSVGNTFDDNVTQNSENVNRQYSLSDNEGNKLTKEQVEYFKDSKVRDENGKAVKMSNEEFKVKLNAEAHIDEIAETSFPQKSKVTDTKNHNFAKDGFSYRTAYFEDFDGQYYKITLSIGHNGEIATVYNVGKINKDNIPSATKIVAVVGSKPLGMSSKNNVSQNSENVKGQYSLSDNEGYDYKGNYCKILHNITLFLEKVRGFNCPPLLKREQPLWHLFGNPLGANSVDYYTVSVILCQLCKHLIDFSHVSLYNTFTNFARWIDGRYIINRNGGFCRNRCVR